MTTAATDRGPSTSTIFRVIFTAAAALLVLYGIYKARSVILSVVIAGFLAVGLDPGVRRLERWGLKRGQSVAAIFLALVLTLAGFALAVVPPLVKQVANFATNLPTYVQDLGDRNPRIQKFIEDHDLADRLRTATKNAPKLIAGSLGGAIGVAGSILASI